MTTPKRDREGVQEEEEEAALKRLRQFDNVEEELMDVSTWEPYCSNPQHCAQKIEAVVKGHTHSVSFTTNMVWSLPPNLGKLPGLEQLTLAGYKFDGFRCKDGDYQHLQRLEMHNVSQCHLPDDIGGCKELRSLVLINTRIVYIPPSLFKCTKLEELRIYSSKMTTLPAEVGRCKALKHLYLGNTMLESIPVELFDCAELETLIVTHTRLGFIPAEVGRLKKLKRLNCSQLALPEELGNCSSLKVIRDSGFCGYIPASIGKLEKLKCFEVGMVANWSYTVTVTYVQEIRDCWSRTRNLIHALFSFARVEPGTPLEETHAMALLPLELKQKIAGYVVKKFVYHPLFGG
jgi:hypothetical protein